VPAFALVPADAYEIFVSSVEEGSEPLFRQRGPLNGLHLDFEEGTEPPAGDYYWEVRALRDGNTIDLASGGFRVRPAP